MDEGPIQGVQFRVTVSLRFSRSAATWAHAACSAGGHVRVARRFAHGEVGERGGLVRRRSVAVRGRGAVAGSRSFLAPTAGGTGLSRKAQRSRRGRRRRRAQRMRSAKARAASTNWASLSGTRAWSGVVVLGRATVQTSRFGASKAAMFGGGTVRFQNV